jgi:hypothetical protein
MAQRRAPKLTRTIRIFKNQSTENLISVGQVSFSKTTICSFLQKMNGSTVTPFYYQRSYSGRYAWAIYAGNSVKVNGNPWKLKIKPKDGALHFDTNGNMLYVAEEDENGSRWVTLGHVVPVDQRPGIGPAIRRSKASCR